MSLAAARLRHRVELQERVDSQAPDGTMTTSWVTVAEPWAAIEPVSGREFLSAAAEQSEVRGKCIIRHREVNAAWRIVYRGQWYNILAVLPDNWSGIEYLTLLYGEGVRLDQ